MACSRTLSADARTAPTLAARALALLGRAWRAFVAWRMRRLTIEILRALDDRTLADIGISRQEIESLVLGRPGERMRGYDAGWYRQRPGKGQG